MTLRGQLLEMSESCYWKFTSSLMPGVENVPDNVFPWTCKGFDSAMSK